MKLIFLGTGTSNGVPEIGCNCAACTSLDPQDKRLRASVIVEQDDSRLLIDCGPDIRMQLIRAGSPHIDAMLMTHSHYDHSGGLIDLRMIAANRSFPIYCDSISEHDIRQFFPYCFVENLYPGVPTFEFHRVKPFEAFSVAGFDIMPLPVMHAKLEVMGYLFGHLAYITDCKTMPDVTLEALKGVDALVINALRQKPHYSHQSLSECLEIIRKISPKRAYITHISHAMGPASTVELPPNVVLAHDMLQIEV